jgi:N-hydroxyarylamine O-acetyltransferase
MNVPAYLERIGYHGGLTPELTTLQALQLTHLRSVPFENLSIHAHQTIALDQASLFRKIVEQGRGGFCYELNGLFAALLDALGFKLDRLAANVCGQGGNFGPDFDHLCLLVHLEEDYLVDVGFGDSFQQPLRVDLVGEQIQGDKSYRLGCEDGHYTLYKKSSDSPAGEQRLSEATPQYRFRLMPHDLVAFEAMCRYHQSSADSHFTQKRICSLALPDGRVSLSDLRLIVNKGQGPRVETVLASEADFSAALRQHFGIVL